MPFFGRFWAFLARQARGRDYIDQKAGGMPDRFDHHARGMFYAIPAYFT